MSSPVRSATATVRGLLMDGVGRGAVGTLTLNVSAVGLNFLITLVLTNALGAHGYGAYAFAFAWSTVLAVPAVLGLSPLVIRQVARYKLEAKWGLLRGVLRHSHRVVLTSSLLLVAGAAVVGVVALPPHPLLGPYLIGLALVPVISLTTIRQAAMQGLGQVVLGRVPETVFAPAAFLLLVVLVSGHLSASAALVIQVVAYGAAYVLGLWLMRRAVPHEARVAKPEYEGRAWNSSAGRLVTMSMANTLTAQLAVIVLGAFYSSTEAGIYQAASRTALFVSFVFMAAGYAVGPEVARLQAANRRDELQELLVHSARTLFLFSAPIAVAFVAFAPQFLALFGGGFRGGSTVLRILVLGEVVRVGTGYASAALVMAHRETDLMWVSVVGLALTGVLSIALIPGLGADGAAIATTAGLIVVQVVWVILAWRRLSLWTAVIGLRAHGSGSRSADSSLALPESR